jgi:hypothetical protein
MADKQFSVDVDSDEVRSSLRRLEGELGKLRDDLRRVDGDFARVVEKSVQDRVQAKVAEEVRKWWEARANAESERANRQHDRAEEVRRDPWGKGLACAFGLFIGLMVALGGIGGWGLYHAQEERSLRQAEEKRGAEAREEIDRQRKFRTQAEDRAAAAERKQQEAEQDLRKAQERLKKAGL